MTSVISGYFISEASPGVTTEKINEYNYERLEDKAPEVVRDYIEENLPRGFLGKAEELIPMILLLCSNDASMMAGCLVPVDAGEGRRY